MYINHETKEAYTGPIPEDCFAVYIPQTTAKELYEKTKNKGGTGKLLYSDWMLKEPFFTAESTHPGWYLFGKEILSISLNKTHLEQDTLLKDKGAIRLNFAELLYVLWAYQKETGDYLLENNWYWTSSLSSGGRLVRCGGFDAPGADVRAWHPGARRGDLGVCFSARVSAPGESLNLMTPTARPEPEGYCQCQRCEQCGKLVKLNN